jgi:sugar/nucleoside kinase (ribokinase family)
VQLFLHSLTLGFEPSGRRFLQKPPDWERWVACADWVQMNEAEARLLGDGRAVPDFARRLLEKGPRGVLVTLGRQGCFAVWRHAGEVRELALDAARHPEPAYPTGCGDVFGASFAYAVVEGSETEAAIRFANAAAGAKACREPYTELRRLRRHVARELELFVPTQLRS